QAMQSIMKKSTHTDWAVVALQDFVIGGGEGREQVEALLADMNVPVLKGLRLSDWTQADHELSAEGIPRNTVHYRVAMPELQGVSQAQVLALASPSLIDQVTGAKLARSIPLDGEIDRQVRRLERWLALQKKANAEKRVAVVYYNHPPGRHNIGADNLNVPESLLEILQALKAAGYTTGELPQTSEALLDLLQERGVNLPENAKALERMSTQVESLTAQEYRAWFDSLPDAVKAEMVDGPLAALHQQLEFAISDSLALDNISLRQTRLKRVENLLHNTANNLRHALDGLRHKGRDRALDLLAQLESEYERLVSAAAQGEDRDWSETETLRDALLAMRIEGVRGWGPAPGKVMVWEGNVLVPGLRFGNVFIGPQPPRGWEINEELLHANLSFPPPHQYLGFYHYLQSVFKADAMVHVGRHSTYEFLPKRAVGLSGEDYPSIVAGDLPGIYPYIVDGVGEGIQAKRRGLAVMVDHLTPPLAATELYDDLLHLRQLIESAEAATDRSTRERAVNTLRADIDRLGLRDELVASMDEELEVRGVGFGAIDDDFLLHEVGHYLTNLQEGFMPLGLHVFGRDWSQTAVDTMLGSMKSGYPASSDKVQRWRQNLVASPAAEMRALLDGLNGRFVSPGKGNDPIRTPEALPTGRNFYALDGSLLPTRVGYDIGRQLADEILAKTPANTDDGDKQGVILWASDAVRDEGAMIAFGMKLLGVRPMWNSRGIVQGLERLPLGEHQTRRLDVLFTTSGLFRDLYGEHLVLLDKASLLALDASADHIKTDYPALTLALESALAPLGVWRRGGNETFEKNRVAANWVKEARTLLASSPDLSADALGRQASLRVFGIAAGSYGAGINRLVERSSAWEERDELAEVFIQRMGHAYGVNLAGEGTQDLFRRQLAGVSQTFLGRASNLYGLMDNNDAFDYLGGFNLAVEVVSGRPPDSAVINHADDNNLRIDDLSSALLGELRGRFLNPQWIKPLMAEGYAGARTMGSEFIEYLWGWQVTSPDIINDRVWEEVKAVYVDDRLDIGLDEFLSESHKRHVQTNILAVMLVAIKKGFWDADADTRQQLAQQFANNILAVGLPGGGHTHPKHPMYELVKTYLNADDAAALEAILRQSTLDTETVEAPSHIQELELAPAVPDKVASEGGGKALPVDKWFWWLVLLAVFILGVGVVRGHRKA
ncbi:MAG TPA: cobalamin biosynthesis protein CobN, partial [Spongiibacteraceae bacterium]|nr:cobalamin biosynthesis protein CobN [Spongiibacteraceae bacterium]